MKLAVFTGTRPEIIKMQPVISEIQKKHDLLFVQTGQHYDFRMSGIFIDELEIKRPQYSLNVKAQTQGVQTANIIKKSEGILEREKPNMVLVEGDTNSALAVALAAAKLGTKIGHIEAGCRSFDKTMPEEINRVLISDLAFLHFSPTLNCSRNLLREGINHNQIFLTGHPIVDLLSNISKKKLKNNLDSLSDMASDYSLVTLHRRENIQNKIRLTEILTALNRLGKKIKIIFPCHPHTKIQINKFGLSKYLKNIHVLGPVGYIDSIWLIKNAKMVISDSGGVQQEAALLKSPCITLRDVTEWVETVKAGVNFLAGYKADQITKTATYVERNYDSIKAALDSSKNIFGKKGVSKRIVSIIEHSKFFR